MRPELSPETHMKIQVRRLTLVILLLGRRLSRAIPLLERQWHADLGVHWAACLAYLASFKPIRGPVTKERTVDKNWIGLWASLWSNFLD